MQIKSTVLLSESGTFFVPAKRQSYFMVMPFGDLQTVHRTIQRSLAVIILHDALLVEQNAKKNAEWFPIGGMPE